MLNTKMLQRLQMEKSEDISERPELMEQSDAVSVWNVRYNAGLIPGHFAADQEGTKFEPQPVLCSVHPEQ